MVPYGLELALLDNSSLFCTLHHPARARGGVWCFETVDKHACVAGIPPHLDALAGVACPTVVLFARLSEIEYSCCGDFSRFRITTASFEFASSFAIASLFSFLCRHPPPGW
jgi:hypothetical protein